MSSQPESTLRDVMLKDGRFRLNNFDLLRIAAAMQVLVLHSFSVLRVDVPAWLRPLEFFPGVPMFFVMSGFLVSASYERSESLSKYISNRCLRIFPGLWACLLVTIVVASFFGFDFVRLEAVGWLGGQMVGLIYTPQFLNAFGRGSYNGSLWTIPVELQFYAFLPLIYTVVAVRGSNRTGFLLAILSLSVVITIILRMFFPGIGLPTETAVEKIVRYSLLPHLFLFMVGVVAQRLRMYQHPLIAGKGLHWLVLYILLCIPSSNSALTYMPSMLVLSICVISLAYTAPWVAERTIGKTDISYGVYIYHGLILNVFIELHWVGSVIYVGVVAVISTLAGYISWVVVERPILRNKTSDRRVLSFDSSRI